MTETTWLIAGGGVAIVLIAALIALTIRKRISERLEVPVRAGILPGRGEERQSEGGGGRAS